MQGVGLLNIVQLQDALKAGDLPESCSISIIIMLNYHSLLSGVSSPPVSPRQSNMSCTCVNITWETPLFDGGAPLDAISITYYSTSNRSQVETLRTESGTDTRLEICNLVPNEIYNASIVALTRVGSSEEVIFEIVIVASGKQLRPQKIYTLTLAIELEVGLGQIVYKPLWMLTNSSTVSCKSKESPSFSQAGFTSWLL